MNISLMGALAVALLAAGCGGGDTAAPPSSPGTNAATGNPLTAPADYAGAAAKSKALAEKTVDTASLNKAVQLFHATEGRYPKDLQELVTTGYLPRIPEAPTGTRIQYDPARGEVTVTKR